MLPWTAASKEDAEAPLVNHVTLLVVTHCHMRLSVVERRNVMQHKAITDFVALVYLILKGGTLPGSLHAVSGNRGENRLQWEPTSLQLRHMHNDERSPYLPSLTLYNLQEYGPAYLAQTHAQAQLLTVLEATIHPHTYSHVHESSPTRNRWNRFQMHYHPSSLTFFHFQSQKLTYTHHPTEKAVTPVFNPPLLSLHHTLIHLLPESIPCVNTCTGHPVTHTCYSCLLFPIRMKTQV